MPLEETQRLTGGLSAGSIRPSHIRASYLAKTRRRFDTNFLEEDWSSVSRRWDLASTCSALSARSNSACGSPCSADLHHFASAESQSAFQLPSRQCGDYPEISTDMRWCAIRATQNRPLTNAFPPLLLPFAASRILQVL